MRNSPKEDKDFGKRFAQSAYADLFGPYKNYFSKHMSLRSSKRNVFYRIKNHLHYPDLCQAADYIDKNVHETHRQLLFGNPLPKSYEDLGVCEFSSTAANFINEINWTLLSVRKFSYEINLFLIYKDEYEAQLLMGNYTGAEKYLDKIENEICYSLWTLENRFLLKESENKGIENKNFLSHFNEINKSEGFTKSLANYLSNRAEKNLSVNRFTADLSNALKGISFDKQEHKDYYLFKLSFLNYLDFSKFTEIISYDFQHSIIDKYLNLRKVLSVMLTTANSKIDSIEEGKVLKDYIINRLNYMLRKIEDPLLNKLKLFAGDKIFPAFNEKKSKKEIDIIDKYTIGQYKEVENELAGYLLEYPQQFDLYILFTKSLIYQNKKFRFIGNPKSIQSQILFDMYKVISATENPKDAALNLLRIANNLTSAVISYGIIDFVINMTNGKSERSLFAKLSYNTANPIIHEVLKDKEAKLNYLTFLQNIFPDSISIEFLLCKNRDINSIAKFEKIIPEAKYKTELAQGLQTNKNFTDAVPIWEYIIINFKDTNPIQETAIRNLFVCYEELKRFDDCVSLFVNSYFINTYLVDKIEVNSLLEKIKNNRFRVVKPTIDLPIFYSICCEDENEIHTAFEKFNLDNVVCKPSELLVSWQNFPLEKILFFLKFTCGLEILRHSTNINGTKERLEERLSIVQFLRDIDTHEKDSYNAEIKHISNILIIQKGLIDLDDGKIYVNEQGIFTNELGEYEAIYNRYKIIADLVDRKKSALYISKGKLTQVNYATEHVESEKIEYSNNPVFDIYSEIFEAIKNKFLYSKDGIVAYLSTRIRHGVLVGEIRPVFERYKLITQKEGDTATYRRNYYWDNVYSLETDYTQAIIQNLLKEFSYSVDGLIFDLIKKYLQVYDEESNKDGWFNYDFEDDVLFWFSIKSIKSSEYSNFVRDVFEILWDRTDENLTKIRENIQTNVLQQFNELFDKLEGDLANQLGQYTSQNLITAIKACSTEMQTVINRISSWFKRSGTSASDFRLESVIDIVFGYADKNNRIDLQRQIDCDSKIKGIYLKHFADLLWIFIDNIIKHADEKVGIIKANISTSVIGEILEINIENAITKKQSLEALRNDSNTAKFDISKLISEGKSGFHKAYKILQYDLLNENNVLSTKVSDNEEMFTVSIQINLKDLLS